MNSGSVHIQYIYLAYNLIELYEQMKIDILTGRDLGYGLFAYRRKFGEKLIRVNLDSYTDDIQETDNDITISGKEIRKLLDTFDVEITRIRIEYSGVSLFTRLLYRLLLQNLFLTELHIAMPNVFDMNWRRLVKMISGNSSLSILIVETRLVLEPVTPDEFELLEGYIHLRTLDLNSFRAYWNDANTFWRSLPRLQRLRLRIAQPVPGSYIQEIITNGVDPPSVGIHIRRMIPTNDYIVIYRR